MSTDLQKEYPIPAFFSPEKVNDWRWRVAYQERMLDAIGWREDFGISPAGAESFRSCLLLVDMQLTFCHPDFELFVSGRSGRGALDDTINLCNFIYRNLGSLTGIVATFDSHSTMQIFHSDFWVDSNGRHPDPYTVISTADIDKGRWIANPEMSAYRFAPFSGEEEIQSYARHYVHALEERGRYPLIIWPYHAMHGSFGCSMAPALQEAVFFHSIARHTKPVFEEKGENCLTENYSVLSPDVLTDQHDRVIAHRNEDLVNILLDYDRLIIGGEASSHCLAWTVEDLLEEIRMRDPGLARKVYILTDCASSVVLKGGHDFTEDAEKAFETFRKAGMHLVKSTEIASFPAQ